MRTIPFVIVLAVAAATVGALLWLLGYWIIAFAVGIAVFAIGLATYFAARAGRGDGKPHGPQLTG